jgi:hypothetical protein
MNATRLWALAALPFFLAACGDGTVDDDTVVVADPATDAGVMTTPPADTHDATQPMTVAMNPIGGSGVSGQMEVMPHGEQTMVNVTLNGPAGANTTHSGHIHAGTCDNPGEVVVPLDDVILSNGTGMASSLANVPASAALNGQHIVAYHEGSGDNPGAPIVCGALPAHGGTTRM